MGSRRLRSRPRYLAPVEVKDIDVYDISPETVGTFDIVLFTGVLYHSRHPLLALECAASVCAGTLVAETVLDATDVARPAMVFYPGAVLKNDPSSWWGPNLPCVEAMLHEVCFEHIRFTPTPIPQKWTLLDRIKQNPEITPRGVFHASRQRLARRISHYSGLPAVRYCCTAMDLGPQIA